MTDEAILDVSMIAHSNSLRKLMALASIQPEFLSGLRVSAAFVDRLSGDLENSDELVRQISLHFAVSRRLIDVKQMQEFIQSQPFREFVQPYKSEGGPRTDEYRRRLLEDVSERDAWAYMIMVEEWEFLTTHSWLFAKTRAIVDHMINSGAEAIYVTKEKLEQAIEHVRERVFDAGKSIIRGSDHLVRRTLKQGPRHEVSPNDRVRTVAKWVAVGGSAASALVNPVVGVLGGSVAGMFLLYDP